MKNFIQKTIALTLAASLLMQSFLPQKLYALGSGPAQPEYSNFESVSTSQMVDPFTGDFTYNLPLLEVPGPNGGGYPISLSYHSGSSPEEDASWVGYGWTLNAGAIMRNKQGFPDDANGDVASYYNKIGKNITVVGGAQTYLKAANIPILENEFDDEILGTSDLANAELGLSCQLTYNNHSGLSLQSVPYFGANIACFSAKYSSVNGEQRYESEFNPAWFVGTVAGKSGINISEKNLDRVNRGVSAMLNKIANVDPIHSPYSIKSYSLYNNSAPTVLQNYTGFSISGKLGAFLYPLPVPVGVGGAIFGTYSQQTPEEEVQHSYYGYLYSHNADNDDATTETDGVNALMDYTVEKQDVYNMRDNYLPIPHAAADMFSVVGEGIGGTFRLYSSRVGHFRPNQQTGSINSFSFDVEAGGGTAIASLTVSASLSLLNESEDENFAQDEAEKILGGAQTLSVSGWNAGDAHNYAFSNEGHEAYYFRFLGDMGGEASYNDISDAVKSASLNNNQPELGTLNQTVNENEGVNRSMYIGYHTNNEMLEDVDGNGRSYKNYSHLSLTREENDQIGEFSITNKNGSNYVYGLPVYAENEYEISVDVQSVEIDQAEDLDSKTIVYKDVSSYINSMLHATEGVENYLEDDQKLVGTSRLSKYAISYLLTQLTAPNYIDLTNDGPTDDDLGGWTKFNYTKKCSDYHWRMPYRGLYYNRGKQSDPNDDMGSFSSGDKEIYYLESIETATHKADFTLEDREDGIEAPSDASAGWDGEPQGDEQSLSKLTKIVLYAKGINGADDQVIKRVYFDYDYSAWDGIPNSTNNGGKLTLTKVWTEYADVSNSKISPYEFIYTYPSGDIYPTKPVYVKDAVTGSWSEEETNSDEYADLEDYGGFSSEDQQPAYSLHASDRWGNYRANGSDLDDNLFPWIDQTPETKFDESATSLNFDPAAWQLKQIILPTGAQIHIQYEQDDYQYVQNRKAMAMVKLLSATNDDGENKQGNVGTTYRLNLAELGITDATEITEMYEYIQNVMIDGYDGRKPEKAYFKFLYNISAGSADPLLDDCTADFIDGYVHVQSATLETTHDIAIGISLQLGSSNATDANWDCPRDACIEFYKTTISNIATSCEISMSTGADYEEGTSATEIGESIYELIERITDVGDYDNICLSLNPDYSYLRLPLPYEKKGGGIRVKRLLSYDPGVESDGADKMVYGHEYLYVDYDGHSSGVASNEPIEGREENALIQFLNKREESSTDQVLAAGHDKSQFEGPIGEGILPSPMVGYSRVLVRNIHRAPTHDGINAFEYHTTKDYPFDKRYNGYSAVQYTDLNLDVDNDPNFLDILTSTNSLDCRATQGYRFLLNGMNGQMKKQTTYSGNWNQYNSPDSLMEVSSISYNYIEPGEKVYALNKNGESIECTPGKASEIIAESKQISDEVTTTTLSVEFGIATTIPFIIPIPYTVSDETHFYTHVTTQTDYYPPFLESTTTFRDGSYSTVSHLYIDELTGEPVVSSKPGIYDQMEYSTNTESAITHNGKYFAYSIPASFYYEGMGQKAGYEGYSVESTTETDGSGTTITKQISDAGNVYLDFTGTYCDVFDKFSVGDLIATQKTDAVTNSHGIWNVTDIRGKHVHLAGASGFYYDETSGEGNNMDVYIIKSGRANMLTLSAGNIVTYGAEFNGTSTYNETQETYHHALANYLNDELATPSANSTSDYPNLESINWYVDGECSVREISNEDKLGIAFGEDCLSEITEQSGYEFFVDAETGSLMYGDPDNSCQATELSCVSLCPLYVTDWENVVSASATTYTNSIDISDDVKTFYGLDDNDNAVETAEAGKWYVRSSYAYKTELENRHLSFRSGTFQDFYPFSWANANQIQSNWINTNTITNYTPDGKMLQAENILDIKSVEKFGYSNNLVYLMANNAQLKTVIFESFENQYTSGRCDGTIENAICLDALRVVDTECSISTNQAHSGSNSLRINLDGGEAELSLYSYQAVPYWTVTQQMLNKGISIKFWAKSSNTNFPDMSLRGMDYNGVTESTDENGNPTFTVSGDDAFTELSFVELAQTGEWKLYEAKVENSQWLQDDEISSLALYIEMDATNSQTPTIYIDDIRMQPLDAQMNCYVYDPASYKLLTEFDDQHFGLYYQYNDEGKLIRKKKETTRGMKTITETQYNIPSVSRTE